MRRLNLFLCVLIMVLAAHASAIEILLPRPDLGGGHLTAIQNLRWSADSELLVTNDEIDVRVWRARDMKLLRVLKASELKLDNRAAPKVAGFVGRERICVGAARHWTVFDWRSGKLVADLSGARLVGEPARLLFDNARGWKTLSLADSKWLSGTKPLPRGATVFSGDMKWTAVPTKTSFEIWDVAQNQKLSLLREVRGAGELYEEKLVARGPVQFSSDGKTLWTASERETTAITIGKMGQRQLMVETSAPLKLWDMRSGRKLREIAMQTVKDAPIQFSATGQNVMVQWPSPTRTTEWKIFSTANGQETLDLKLNAAEFGAGSYVLAPNGKNFVTKKRAKSLQQSQQIARWKVQRPETIPLALSAPAPQELRALMSSRNGRWLIVAADRSAQAWNVAAEKPVPQWNLSRFYSNSETLGFFGPDSVWVGSGVNPEFYDLSGQTPIFQSSTRAEHYHGLVFPNPNGQNFVIVKSDKDNRFLIETMVYDADNQTQTTISSRLLPPLSADKLWVSPRFQLSPDGCLLFIAQGDGYGHELALFSYDLQKALLVGALPGAGQKIIDNVLQPAPFDSRPAELRAWQALLASDDGAIIIYDHQLWNTRQKRAITLQSTTRPQAISHDGKIAVLLTAEARLQLLDIASHRILQSWKIDALQKVNFSCPAAFAPDGKTVYLGVAGYIYICDTQTGRVQEILNVPATPGK